jgi:pimeloyl-ACP methyl ester carboxylesterase
VFDGGLMTFVPRFRRREIPAAVLTSRYGSAPSQFLQLSNGSAIHYRDEGPSNGRSHPTLVLLHGGSLSLFCWEQWVRQLRASMRVITVDLPGHGLTGATADGDYSPGAMERFVDVFIRALGLSEPFVLAGHSAGGHVAWRFALNHPEQLTGLVLIAPGGISEPSGPQGRILRLVRAPGGAWLFRALLTRDSLAAALKAVVFNPALITSDMANRAWELNNRQGTLDATVARFREPGSDPALVERLKEIRVPALVLWGREDVVFPLSQADVFTKAIPSAQLVVYDHCGHWPMEEFAERSAGEVQAFVAKLMSGD